MADVLVTGATGFIGAHLVEMLLRRGEEVTSFVRNPARAAALAARGARLIQGEIGDLESLRHAVSKKSVVFHLAGLTTTLKARNFFEVNRRGVSNIARVCREQSNPPVLVLVSSLAAAGPAVAGRPRVETDPPRPVSNYGRSKRGGEKAAERYAGEVPITIVRPPIVFGEADRLSLEIFKTIARTGVHPVPGYRPRQYSMIHVGDLVEALWLAAVRGGRLPADCRTFRGGAGYYFAACDEHPSWYQFGRMIGKALGRRLTLTIPFGTPMVRVVGAFGELAGRIRGVPQAMNLDKSREATAGSWTCSARKAQEELGFAVSQSLAERLRQTVDWYRSEGWL